MNPTFLSSVLEKIENKTARDAIGKELESHLLDKRDYYLDLGYSEDEAHAKAEEDMGAPDDCAVPLNALHHMRRRTPLRMAALLFVLAFLAIALFWSNPFCYGSERLLAVFHSIGMDFLSFGCITGFAVLLLCAQKRRDKTVAAAVLIGLSLYGVITLFKSQTQSPFGLLQPAVYAAYTLLTKGFDGYANRIFAYQYTPWEEKSAFVISAAVIFAVLVMWAAVVFLGIHLQERMHRTKHLQRGVKLFQIAAGVLLCANLLLMASGTVIAVLRLPDKQKAAQEERKYLIELVCLHPGDIRAVLAKDNYQLYYNTETLPQYCNADGLTNNTLLCATYDNTFSDTGDAGMYGFSVTNFASDLPLLSCNTRLTADELAQLSAASRISLDAFLQTECAAKAITVTRQSGGYADNNGIYFIFFTESGSKQYINFHPIQKDGKTVWINNDTDTEYDFGQEDIAYETQ